MAIGIHVVRVGLFTVDSNGQRIDKTSNNLPINTMKNTSMDSLVIPDAAIPSSAGYPKIKTYLELEAASGYKLQHMDQTFIITYPA